MAPEPIIWLRFRAFLDPATFFLGVLIRTTAKAYDNHKLRCPEVEAANPDRSAPLGTTWA